MIKKLEKRIGAIKVGNVSYDAMKSASLNEMHEKINELIDAVNELQNSKAKAKDRMIGCTTLDIPKSYIKSCRMDKEFAEDECARLQDELEHAKKQLVIYNEFVTKLYLNGNITDESLIRLQKRLYIRAKGDDNE